MARTSTRISLCVAVVAFVCFAAMTAAAFGVPGDSANPVLLNNFLGQTYPGVLVPDPTPFPDTATYYFRVDLEPGQTLVADFVATADDVLGLNAIVTSPVVQSVPQPNGVQRLTFKSTRAGLTQYEVRAYASHEDLNTPGTFTVRPTISYLDTIAPTTSDNALATYPCLSGANITLTPLDNTGGSGVPAGSTYYRIAPTATFTPGTSVAVPSTAGVYTLYYYSVDAASNTETPVKSKTFTVSAMEPVWRFVNLKSGYYLWTASAAERANINATMKTTWKEEGEAYTINTANLDNQSQLYRFRNNKGGFYLYTANEGEKNNIVNTMKATWTLEGPAYKVSTNPVGGDPVWRFRNIKNGTYLLTGVQSEKDNIVNTMKATWLLEGPAFYIAKP